MKTIFALGLFLLLLAVFLSPAASANTPWPQGSGTGSSPSGTISGGPGGSYDYWTIPDAQDRSLRDIPNDLDLTLGGTLSEEGIIKLYKKRGKNLTTKKLRRLFREPCLIGWKVDGCPYWKHQKKSISNNYQELKLSYGAGGRRGNRGPDAVASISVRIWRESPNGNMKLILDRSIAGDGQTGNDNGWQVPASEHFWRGKDKGFYTQPGLDGGPIGANHAPLQNCRYGNFNPAPGSGNPDIDLSGNSNSLAKIRPSLYKNGVNFREEWGSQYKAKGECYWEGNALGNPFSWSGNVFDWIRSNGLTLSQKNSLSDTQFGGKHGGPKKSWSTNRWGIAGKGLKEAVYLKWFIPNGKGRARLKTKILGVPGVVYAVQHVYLSERGEIINQRFFAKVFNKTASPSPPQADLTIVKTGEGNGSVTGDGISCSTEAPKDVSCDTKSFNFAPEEGAKYITLSAIPDGSSVAEECQVTVTPYSNATPLNGGMNQDGSQTKPCYTKVQENKKTLIMVPFELKEEVPDWQAPTVSFELDYPENTVVQKEETITSTLSVDRTGSSGSGSNTNPTEGSESMTVDPEGNVGDENPSADIFPVARTFFHYTPQAKYSSGKYNETGYALYDKPNPLALSLDSMNINKNPTKGNQEKLMHISSPETVESLSPNSDGEYTGSLQVTWQKPTLQNPCSSARSYDYQAGKWPEKPRTGFDASGVDLCSDNSQKLFNAWSDLLIGQVAYDEVYQGSNGTNNNTTQYGKFPLRCPLGQGQSVSVSVGGDCPWGSKLSAGLPVAGRFAPALGADGMGNSPARVVLDSSVPQELSVTDGEQTVTTNSRNPLTGKMEINLCTPGRAQQSKPSSILPGDPDCLAPSADWKWTESYNIYECQDSPPNLASYIQGGAAKASTVGDNSALPWTAAERIRYGLFAGNWPAERIPYQGKLPRANGSGEVYRCAYRPQVQTVNVFYEFQVRNESYYVKARTRHESNGKPDAPLPAGGTSWEKLENKKCKPENPDEDNNITFNKLKNDAVGAEKYNCWYSKFIRSGDVPSDSAGWGNWDRVNNSKCNKDDDSRGFSRSDDNEMVCFWRAQQQNSPPTGDGWQKDDRENWRCWPDSDKENTALDGMEDKHHTCYFKWTRQWHYGFTQPNWNYFGGGQNGYVTKGRWELMPLDEYSRFGEDDLQRYIGPGYVRHNGYRIGSEEGVLFGDEGISVRGKSGSDWGLYAFFNTYSAFPYFYKRPSPLSESGYVSVLAPRMSG